MISHLFALVSRNGNEYQPCWLKWHQNALKTAQRLEPDYGSRNGNALKTGNTEPDYGGARRMKSTDKVSVFAPVLLVAVCALPLMVMKNICRCCKLHYYTVVIEWQREIAGCIAAFEKGTNTNLCH